MAQLDIMRGRLAFATFVAIFVAPAKKEVGSR